MTATAPVPASNLLLGTYYGGNGTSNFQLPNLQGNVPVGFGNGPSLTPYVIGETAGPATVALAVSQTPPHNHTYPIQSIVGTSNVPVAGSVPARNTGATPPQR